MISEMEVQKNCSRTHFSSRVILAFSVTFETTTFATFC